MGNMSFVTRLQPSTLDLVGKPVSGLDGKVIGKVVGIETNLDRGDSSMRVDVRVDDDKAWQEMRHLMGAGMGLSFGGTVKVEELGFFKSVWLSFRINVGEFLIGLGRRIRG